MESIPLLKKLSKKSVFSFGKYKGCYVGQVIDLDKTYIGYVYYNINGLSFTDDILDELGIKDNLVISKPSVDADKFRLFTSQMIHNDIQAYKDKYGDTKENDCKAYFACKKRNVGRMMAEKRCKQAYDNTKHSARNLQAVNHGNKFYL